jgi:protein-tyrosine phosphatase
MTPGGLSAELVRMVPRPVARTIPVRTLCFRDFAGLRTEDGRQIRSGRIFRSSGLEELSDADVELLVRTIGLATVIDLRDAAEADLDGVGPLSAAGLRYWHVPFTPPDASRPKGTLLDRYRAYLEQGRPAIRRVFELIAGEAALPAVFHCLVGKDRTGIVSALLLGALGVSREAIIADYSYIPYDRSAFKGFVQRRASCARIRDEDFGSHLFDAPPDVMRELLGDLDRDHGGIRPYLLANGFDPAVLHLLEELLLEPATG